MYGLSETPDEIQKAFSRTSDGKARKKDFRLLDTHIKKKKQEIRLAKEALGMDGVKGRKQPAEHQPLQAIMKILDGGRR
jgi:hypothetical protein|tara:strand:+ start:59 stop:295 length:237 start_codon:yes stop_codon:yes gene_type:complete